MINVFEVDEDGNTPLHFVAQFDLVEVAAWFVANGSRLGIYNNKKQTPLDVALERGRVHMVRYLQKIYPLYI